MNITSTAKYIQQALESCTNVVDELKIKIDAKSTLNSDDIYALNTLPAILNTAKHTVLKLLNAAGYTQVEIAEKLDISPARVSQLLNPTPLKVSDLKYSENTITILTKGIKVIQDSLTAFVNEEDAVKILSESLDIQYRLLKDCLMQNGYSDNQIAEFLQLSEIAPQRSNSEDIKMTRPMYSSKTIAAFTRCMELNRDIVEESKNREKAGEVISQEELGLRRLAEESIVIFEEQLKIGEYHGV